jgi:hypothetical protein
MSWKELHIEDPGLKWDSFGTYQHWNTNKLGDLFEKTMCEVEEFQISLYDMMDLGLFKKQIDNLLNWVDHIESLLDDASTEFNARNKLIDARIELYRFKKHFDGFAFRINWFGA